jgi:hypothetical protein
MKPVAEIETVLARLGAEWPAESSIVDGVMQTIQSRPTPAAAPKHRRIFIKSLIGIAASLAVFAALWWTIDGSRNSLYAQAIDAVHKARTLHVTYYAAGKGETEPMKESEIWYDSEVGVRSDSCGQNISQYARLDNEEYSWSFDREKNVVTRFRRRGAQKQYQYYEVRLLAEIDRHVRQLQDECQRYPKGDKTFDGQPCKAYLVVKLGRYLNAAQYHDASSLPVDFRLILYLDQQSRLVRDERQDRRDNSWTTTGFHVIQYDETLDPAVFEPNFGKDVKIVDVDVEFPKPEQSVTPAKPQGPVLVYEVDPKSKPAGMTAAEMDNLVKVVDGRINAGTEKLAIVRKLDDRRLEIALIRRNGKDRKRVEQQLARSGTLEFRILANNRVDNAVIERARKEPAKTEVLDSSGKRAAWWVPVKAGGERNFQGNSQIVSRSKKIDHREVVEVLVIADPYNVTDAYLTAAKASLDYVGKPCVDFTFNNLGGELFGRLTGDHVPNELTNFSYKLGIIIDGEIFSVPTVQSKIGNRGQISGSFTKDEASDLAATLNAGSLPVRLRLVESHAPAGE